MDTGKALIVILLGVGGAIALPVLLYLSLRNSNAGAQWNLLKKAASRSTKPWVTEDASLAELSRRVAELKKIQAPDDPAQEPVSQPENEGENRDR